MEKYLLKIGSDVEPAWQECGHCSAYGSRLLWILHYAKLVRFVGAMQRRTERQGLACEW